MAQVAGSPQYEIATRGNTGQEILNVCFIVDDPLTRSPYLAARKANIVFNHAGALWYLADRDDLAMIGHYAPRLRGFSADGQPLTGTAYGPRLFGPGPGGPASSAGSSRYCATRPVRFLSRSAAHRAANADVQGDAWP